MEVQASLTVPQISRSSVGKLPIESLTPIFKMCLESSPTFPFVTMDRMSAPIVLLLVCRHWNNIVLSTPSLWASLHAAPEVLCDARLMATWLKRSGREPLRLSFNAVDGEIADIGFDVILRYRARWQHVAIDWSRKTELAPLSSYNTTSTSLHLETFELRTRFGKYYLKEDYDVATQLGSLLKSSTNLRSFYWEAQVTHIPSSPTRLLAIATSQLRHLHLTYFITLPNVLEVLKQSPLLEECTFTFVERYSQQLMPTLVGEVVMPNLRAFTLQTDQDLSSFFSTLSLPSLTHLDIETHRLADHPPQFDYPDWPHTEFMALLARSACVISNLRLFAIKSEPDLIDCLKHVGPALESLYVGTHGNWLGFVGEQTLAVLTNLAPSQAQTPARFPKLKGITFDYSLEEEGLPSHALADMVESRWCFPEDEVQFANPIITIINTDIQDADMRRIKVMQARGESGEIIIHLD